jgi:hypothetical protein
LTVRLERSEGVVASARLVRAAEAKFSAAPVEDPDALVVTRRFSGDERFALVAAVIIVSVMTVFVAVLVGDSWSIGAEVLRVGNGHLSYRTERLPWRQYRPAIIATALGVFWLVAGVRVKTERVQAAERRGHVRH